MDGPGLTITTEEADGGVRVALAGELDTESADEVSACFDDAVSRGTSVAIDLSGLAFVDSTGLTLLLQVRSAAERNGVALSIGPSSPAVDRLVDLTGLRARIFGDAGDATAPPG